MERAVFVLKVTRWFQRVTEGEFGKRPVVREYRPGEYVSTRMAQFASARSYDHAAKFKTLKQARTMRDQLVQGFDYEVNSGATVKLYTADEDSHEPDNLDAHISILEVRPRVIAVHQ